ncbi:MAG: hypothetical protein ACM3VZ_11030 [Acidobacteriota bacterium]
MTRNVKQALAPRLSAIAGWIAAATVAAVSVSLPAQADEAYALTGGAAPSGLKFSGFGTLGYWLSNGPDDLRFRRELGQNIPRLEHHHERADSRLGLQLNYQANDKLEWVGQVVAREKADARVFNSVEWAFLKYHPTDDTQLRLGRVGLDLFMLSDYRSVGYAYNWVRPPAEFYGWIPFYSVDGGDVVKSFPVGEGQLKVKAFGGVTQSSMPWGGDSYKLRANIAGLGVAWESDEWRLRAFHTRLKFRDNAPYAALIPALQIYAPLWPSGAQYIDDLQLQGQRLTYSVLGAAWDHDGWQVSSEVALTHGRTTFAPQGTSAYVSVGRRFDKWVPFVSFARSWDSSELNLTDPPVSALDPLAMNIRYAYMSTHTRQYTASAGVRWDVADRVAVKVQWDRSVVAAESTQMWGLGAVPWTGGAKHVWSATLDFTF